jgi:hypothetical protein
MCNTFATRFGPSPFSEMVAELQCKHHAELELMYLDAACYYNLHGSIQIPPFSPFTNKLCFAGAPPSVQYLKAMFTNWVIEHQVYIEHAQACLPANVMKVYHTFDVCFHCSEDSVFILMCCTVSEIHGRTQGSTDP